MLYLTLEQEVLYLTLEQTPATCCRHDRSRLSSTQSRNPHTHNPLSLRQDQVPAGPTPQPSKTPQTLKITFSPPHLL